MKKNCILNILLVIVTVVALGAEMSWGAPGDQNRQLVVLSRIFHIDREYMSMDGPSSENTADFSQGEKPELLWVTGFKAEVIDPVTKAPLSPEFFCHTNLQFQLEKFDITKRKKEFGAWTKSDFKLVSLVQGKAEVNLPEGFGIPIMSDEPLSSFSMVINPNPHAKPFDVQVKATYTYIKDSEKKLPMKPLVRRVVSLRVPVSKGQDANSKMKCGCEGEMETAQPVPSTPDNVFELSKGPQTSYHWFVPPGRHRYTYTWGKGLKIPYDTTVHFIGIHLHPYGTYMELRDKTTGKIVFKGKSKDLKGHTAVADITHVESQKGIPFFANHEYEIKCEYNNTSKKEVNAMAMVYLYYFNKEFDNKSF